MLSLRAIRGSFELRSCLGEQNYIAGRRVGRHRRYVKKRPKERETFTRPEYKVGRTKPISLVRHSDRQSRDLSGRADAFNGKSNDNDIVSLLWS
jgi:hypothetical protein